MRAPIACLLLLVAGLAPCRADFVIVQRVEGGMQQGTITAKIKDTKARADLAPEVSTITDGGTGEVITLMHGKKSFMRIPLERSRELAARMEKMQKNAQPNAVENPALVPSGKKEKIENFECELFTWSGNGISATYWVARDYPNFAAVTAAMEKSLNGGLAELTRRMAPKRSAFPGMVIKTEMTVNGQKVVTTLVSVTEENVDAALFVVPADYTEAPSPSFNFPAAK